MRGYGSNVSLLFWRFLRILLICGVVYCCFWVSVISAIEYYNLLILPQLIFIGVCTVNTTNDAEIILGFAFANSVVQVTVRI